MRKGEGEPGNEATEASTVDLVCTILTTFYHMHRYSYAAIRDKQRRLHGHDICGFYYHALYALYCFC